MRVLRPFLIAAVLCIPAVADQITVNNGDRLTGKVVTADEKAVILHTTYAGDIKIERSTIVAIESDEMLNITTKDAGSMKGKIAVSGTSANIAKADGTSVTATPGAITAIRNDEAQMAYEREQERLTRPRLNDFWSGFMALGVASAGGNSSTTAVSTSASATRVAGKNKMVLSFAQLYATQRTTAPFGQTANKVSGAFRVDRDLTSRLFVYGLNSYDYDKFQNLDLRVVLGGGLGYHVWKSDRGYLDLALGGDWNREAFGAFNATPAFVRNSGELTVGEEAAYSVAKLKLFERFAVLPNLTSTGNYRMVFDSTASLPFAKWLEWNLGFTDRFLSNPPDGIKKNDTIFTMGVRFSFDQTKRR